MKERKGKEMWSTGEKEDQKRERKIMEGNQKGNRKGKERYMTA